MRNVLSLGLTFVMILQLVPAAWGAESLASQITAMKPGARIEVRLKNKQKLRGTRGEVSATGFTLLNPSAGDQHIAFDDVTSVSKNASTKKKVIIAAVCVVGAAVVVVVTFVVLVKTRTIPVV